MAKKAEIKMVDETEVKSDMSQSAGNLATMEETPADEPAPSGQGVRTRRVIVLKQFVPGPDWINQNVVAKGKGTQVMIGRIYGVAFEVGRKTGTLPDGSPSENIFVRGQFESLNYITGEVGEASTVYFPKAYAEKLEMVFKGDETIKVVEVDVDVGVEATGKTIPYEWVTVAFVEGGKAATLKRLRTARAKPAQLLLTAS